MKPAVKVKEKEIEKYVTKGEVKVDWRDRETIFEVKSNGVTVDWTANYTEAVSSARASAATSNAVIYSINMATGQKTLHV